MRHLPTIAATVLIAAGIVLPQILGGLWPDYSSVADYISELGALGAPHASIATHLGFLPVALAVTTLIVVLQQRLPRTRLVRVGLACLLGIAVGYLGAWAFPCDAGCPASGSDRQALHNLAGLIEYAGAVGGLFVLYFGLRATREQPLAGVTLAVACVVTLGIGMMFSPGLAAITGLAQRVADYSLFVWLCCAVVMTGPTIGRSNDP